MAIQPYRPRRKCSDAESAYFSYKAVVDVGVLVAVDSALDKRTARPLCGVLPRAPRPTRDLASL